MAEERRVDPSDGSSYTFSELTTFYQDTYKKKALQAYWDDECRPVLSRRAAKAAKEAQPKGKAKAKAKAQPEFQPKDEPRPKAAARRRKPANPKRFIDSEASAVQDSIDGFLWTSPNVSRLDSFPDIKVLVRTDWDKEKVAIISGGGAGHEPMHGGFVGKGMLTAAVSGETFASPSIDAVLAAIVHVTGPKGCLVVIKNYTGDRLNFSLAVQRARADFGLKVEVVITRDDVATSAERGIAGTLFVHKIAGALAEAGKSLEEVKAAAEAVVASSASMGVSFSSVRRLKPEMIGPRKMEVGLGIHGEPGARVEAMAPATKVVEIIMEGAMGCDRLQGEAPHGFACLINNLGSVPPLEMSIVTGALMKSKWGDSIKLLVGPAGLCTSLDMNGVSLSLLKLTPELAEALKAETAVAAWPKAVAPKAPEPVKGVALPNPLETVEASSDDVVRTALEKVCEALIAAKGTLDDLDGKVGDADCGTTMAKASTDILALKDKLPFADPQATCSYLSLSLGKSMGGSSGVLLSIMFMGMANSFKGSDKKSWAEGGAQALMDGLQAMMDAGGAKKGSRTMLDAMIPAAEALLAGKGLAGAKEAAQAGAEKTKGLAPLAGRSENVPESVWKGVEDPGAKAASLVFAALAS